MVKQADLASDLRSAVGDGSVLPPERHVDFAVDGLEPRAVVAPSTYEQVAETMRYAHAGNLAVIPWGGGTHMHVGNLPRRYDIALSLSCLNRVTEHEPADLTVTCQGGIPLAELQRHLGQKGQLVPLDAARNERATVGGVLAANVSGPCRHAYGSARDFTIGLRVVTADGRITRAGGKVVKNVAGYDLCKLYIGSMGTLGVIVEATFKAAPLPRAERSLAVAFPSPVDACALAAELHRRGLSMRSLQLLNPTAASGAGLAQGGLYFLILDLAGSPPAVDRSCQEIEELARSAGAKLAEIVDGARAWETVRSTASADELSLSCKASVLPAELPALIQAFERAAGSLSLVALPTIGVISASWPRLQDAEPVLRYLRDLISEAGGSLVVEACPLDLKGRIDVFGDPPPAFELMRRVKQQFDPRGVLSPGRFLGRL